MGEFLVAPVFLPIRQPLQDGSLGQVLTITSGGRAWATPAAGGGVGTYLSNAPLASGVINNYNPAGFGTGVGRLDIDTTVGNIELTGLLAGADAQLLIVTNIGANLLTLDSQNAGSLAANRFRLPAQMGVVQNDALLLCYYGGTVNRWCMA